MSATNAISGISLIGSLVVAGAQYGALSTFLGFVAVACSATNVVGGFLITDRMLKMFKSEKDRRTEGQIFNRESLIAIAVVVVGLVIIFTFRKELGSLPAHEVLRYLYILSAVLFILGLKGLSSPKWARKGMFLAEFGMVVAVVGTLFHEDIRTYTWIILGLIIGAVVGGTSGLRIPMTSLPQRTPPSHWTGA